MCHILYCCETFEFGCLCTETLSQLLVFNAGVPGGTSSLYFARAGKALRRQGWGRCSQWPCKGINLVRWQPKQYLFQRIGDCFNKLWITNDLFGGFLWKSLDEYNLKGRRKLCWDAWRTHLSRDKWSSGMTCGFWRLETKEWEFKHAAAFRFSVVGCRCWMPARPAQLRAEGPTKQVPICLGQQDSRGSRWWLWSMCLAFVKSEECSPSALPSPALLVFTSKASSSLPGQVVLFSLGGDISGGQAICTGNCGSLP